MYSDNNVVIILLVIILIYSVYTSRRDGFQNRFQVNQFNIDSLDVIDESSNKHLVYDYLLTDGRLFYLYNSRDLIIERRNPLIFETLDEADKYRKSTSTKPLKTTNIFIKKNKENPTENYERMCAKKIAPFNSRMNTCFAYSKTEEDLEKNKDLMADLSASDHQLESCIIDAIGEENPDLTIESNNQKEIKFMDQFF